MTPRIAIAAMFCAAGLAFGGCSRQEAGSGPAAPNAAEGALQAEALPDGSWQCTVKGVTYVFRDPDNDGLATSCDIYKGGALRRTVIFPRRQYAGFPLAPGGLKSDEVDGINVLILPSPPLTETPMRSERVKDPELLKYLCRILNERSYTRTLIDIQNDNEMGGFVDFARPVFSADRLGMEMWFKGDNEPLTIILVYVNEPYHMTGLGLSAKSKGESKHFGNDDFAAILCGVSGATTFDEMNLWRFSGGWLLPRGPFRGAAYHGGVPIRSDGSPDRTVTLQDKTNQAKDLLDTYAIHMLIGG